MIPMGRITLCRRRKEGRGGNAGEGREEGRSGLNLLVNLAQYKWVPVGSIRSGKDE